MNNPHSIYNQYLRAMRKGADISQAYVTHYDFSRRDRSCMYDKDVPCPEMIFVDALEAQAEMHQQLSEHFHEAARRFRDSGDV